MVGHELSPNDKLHVSEYTSYGTTHRVYLVPGKWIQIHTHRANELINIKTFAVGDVAEYDSFNLKYLGSITGITAKTVTIQPPRYRGYKRLKLEHFAWRNAQFDLEKITRENAETMNHI